MDKTLFDNCKQCNGSGKEPNSHYYCPDCGGTGLKGGRYTKLNYNAFLEKELKKCKENQKA